MKFQFEPDLDFQRQAIDAVCDVFEGQTESRSPFTVLAPTTAQVPLVGPGAGADTLGVGNALELTEGELLTNLRRVQLRHGLPLANGLSKGELDLTVEMETGTGKTYVYLRTIFELNQRFGFSKFIIVVPSVAIKEGVNKSIKIMKEHFAGLYDNPPFDHFVYDSSQPGQVRNFATSASIQVMVATIQGLRRTDLTLFHQPTEKLGGAEPVELIREVRPIVIVDEPQSVEGGQNGAGLLAIQAMQPLCTLRYSATHIDKYEMVYRLDALDAYERKLVKGIEVASAKVEGAHDRPYVRVESVEKKGNRIWARLELDCAGGPSGVTREIRNVNDQDDLEQITGRPVYKDVRVGEIYRHYKDRRVQLFVPGDELWLLEGERHGGIDLDDLHRQMIKRTIRQHLTRELSLTQQGIKVLTLFFVDRVEHYRSYDDGNEVQGKYARIFEEEYNHARKHPDFQPLFPPGAHPAASEVHDGYFSIDKQRRWTDTKESNASGRLAAQEAYALIMKEKETLLDLKTPLKFIFSHSALKEGWDNPNVFQICSLREMNSERQRRQSIGRGLRLCVNQHLVRVRDDSINRLTVIATESVRDFAAKLQKEIEEETGIEFGKVNPHSFAHILVEDADSPDGEPKALGTEASERLFEWLKEQGYVKKSGKVEDKLKRDLNDGTLTLPEEFAEQETPIQRLLRKLTRNIEIKDADQAQKVRVNRQVFDSPEFRALWDRIKHKTVYQVRFDAEELLASCIEEMKSSRFNPGRGRVVWTKADVEMDAGGVHAGQEILLGAPSAISADRVPMPDVLTELQDATGLTRKSIAEILLKSGRLYQLTQAPQLFLKATADLINRKRREALIEGIQYERLGDSDFYAMSLFEDEPLMAYIGDNTVETSKAPYEHVVYDSAGIEQRFAEFLQGSSAVKLFAKLPSWFKIPTPLGTYNPDWAVLVDTDDGERLYFVVETKGSLDSMDLRGKEGAKIHCGERHFRALAGEPGAVSDGPPAKYIWATKEGDFTKHWSD